MTHSCSGPSMPVAASTQLLLMKNLMPCACTLDELKSAPAAAAVAVEARVRYSPSPLVSPAAALTDALLSDRLLTGLPQAVVLAAAAALIWGLPQAVAFCAAVALAAAAAVMQG